MRKTAIALLVVGLCLASTAFASNAMRISQVYGGGGGSGYYVYDYVELFNDSGSPVDISGWSIQYGSATGTSFGSSTSNMAVLPANSIVPPCGYFLVQVGGAGTSTTSLPLPVTPDFINSGGPSISQSSGKIALINNATGSNLCSGNTSGPIYVDVVGFGSANCYETAPTPILNNAAAAVRNGGGMVDTDNNSADFTVVNCSVNTIHNSTMTNADCLATPAVPTTWGKIKTLYR